MGQLTRVKEVALEALRLDPRFSQVDLMGEYAGSKRQFPVKKPTITVGIDSVEAMPGGLGRHMGTAGDILLSGSVAKVTLRLDCYIPEASPLGGMHSLFEAVCECLAASFGISRIWCSEAKAERASLSTTLCIKATTQICLAQGIPSVGVDDIIVEHRSD